MNSLIRDRYLGDSFATASPATLLVQLYDRLILDLEGAESAISAGDVPGSHALLTHAQDIVIELHVTLDVDAWSGGRALADLYSYVTQQLIEANLTKDAARVVAARDLLTPLRDAWRQAALESARPAQDTPLSA